MVEFVVLAAVTVVDAVEATETTVVVAVVVVVVAAAGGGGGGGGSRFWSCHSASEVRTGPCSSSHCLSTLSRL